MNIGIIIKNKSGDIIGNAIGYRVQDLVDSFDNYISNYNRDGHQYTFIFNGKEIKIDCSNGGNVIIDGEIREYKQTPGLKKR